MRGTDARTMSLIKENELEQTVEVFHPDFGVTVLGSSHGFDAGGRTTGFIVWMNGFGICRSTNEHADNFRESWHQPKVNFRSDFNPLSRRSRCWNYADASQ